jgi:phosphoribosylglycinamide formyltransferase 1
MDRPKVAALVSGEGTTVEAFIRASVEGLIKPRIVLVISSNENAGVFNRIRNINQEYNLDIECVYLGKQNYPPAFTERLSPGDQTQAEEAAILNKLLLSGVEIVVLMGYMKKIGPRIVHEFGWRHEHTSPFQARMLNTHPGLLPATKGLYGDYVQAFVLEQKYPFGGQTLHVVSEDYDEGPKIAEHKVKVQSNDTAESLFDRVKETEKKYLPKDIANFIEARKKFLAKEA